MEIDGKRFKERRIQSGFSQKTLASGICTQPTISLIEQQNHVPSFQTFQRLCHRLACTPVDFLPEKQDNRLEFKKVAKVLSHGQYADAQAIIDQFKGHTNEVEEALQLYYFQGMIDLGVANYNEALLNFQRVLVHYNRENNVWEILATVGIATTYFHLKKNEWAEIFLDKVLAHQQFFDLSATMHQKLEIIQQLAELQLALGKINQSIELAELGIGFCRTNESTFLLAKLFTNLGEAYGQRNETARQAHYLQIAESLEKGLAEV